MFKYPINSIGKQEEVSVTTQKKRFVIWMLLLGVMLTFVACAKKEPIVAKVGRYKITVDDFKNGFIQKYRGEKAAMKRSFDDRRAFAEELANQKLLVAEAYSRGYDKRPEVIDEVNQMAKRKAYFVRKRKYLYEYCGYFVKEQLFICSR